MGYAQYTLPDGREAGYSVEAKCDVLNCESIIWRGMDWLCGEAIEGRRQSGEYGCGNYFCVRHQQNHSCINPECGQYSFDGNLYCIRAQHSDLSHMDHDGEAFNRTEN